MLKRLYVHNYKCLVNFEINFDQDISLFLGANGSGKSTVFEVLNKLRRVILDEEKVENVFSLPDVPRWLVSDAQKGRFENISFETDVEIEGGIYKYSLSIRLNDSFNFTIKEETLYCNNGKIIESKDGIINLVKDNLKLPFNHSHSNISRYFNDSPFLRYHTLFIARINPYEVTSIINNYNTGVRIDFSNFAEWFAYLQETNRRAITNFEKEIRNILPNYDIFTIQPAGQAKLLQFEFENTDNKKSPPIAYYFNELSEGQKVLIVLYALIYCTPDNSILCIDEPENFLALPEIQPWFNALYDQSAERNLQVLLISHHPKIINLLANDSGYWFSRENNLTRIQKITPEDKSGLSIAELIERGWIYEH